MFIKELQAQEASASAARSSDVNAPKEDPLPESIVASAQPLHTELDASVDEASDPEEKQDDEEMEKPAVIIAPPEADEPPALPQSALPDEVWEAELFAELDTELESEGAVEAVNQAVLDLADDSEDESQNEECLAESGGGCTSSDLGSDSETEDTSSQTQNKYQALDDAVKEEDGLASAVLASVEEDSGEESEDESEPSSSRSKEDSAKGEEPVLLIPQPVRTNPQLAIQEDFDLSPVSENSRMDVGGVSYDYSTIKRAKSKESVDSAKLCTETEFSDWADNSLGGDMGDELRMDMEPNAPGQEYQSQAPYGSASVDSPIRFDDIEFADGGVQDPTPPVVASPDPQPPKTVDDSPEVLTNTFSRLRDSIAVCRDKEVPFYTPSAKDDASSDRDLRRRLLEKKYESSPNLVRKKEAIQERERLGDLVRDLVLSNSRISSRIQRSPEKKERRGSYGSLTPPSGMRSLRAESEPRNITSYSIDLTTPASSLRPVSEIVSPSQMSVSYNGTESTPIIANVSHDVSTPPAPRPPAPESAGSVFKTPSFRDLKYTTSDRDSVRQEARAKAQAKADQDLGLSPPDYISNLKDKLRRKPSVNDDEFVLTRTRSFSEPQSDFSDGWNGSATSSSSAAAAAATDSGQMDKYSALEEQGSPPPTYQQPMKTSKSVPQILNISSASPPSSSPRSDVIRSMFLNSQNTPDPGWRPPSQTPSSPPQSPRSGSSSNSASYLWAGLSPAESEAKLNEQSGAEAATQSTKSKKKSKDPERRRSLIQTITGLFSKKDDSKEPDSPKKSAKDTAKSPSLKDKFPHLLKLSPKKDKPKMDKLLPDDLYDNSRIRSFSSPVSPTNGGLADTTKPRADSLHTSPTSTSEATPLSSGFDPQQGSSSNSPWSAFSFSGGRRQSKQAKLAARQTELKRLRMAQSIQRQLEEIEVKQKELEDQGVSLEKALRGEDGSLHGRDESALMQEWFQLVHEKNGLSRYEQELMVRARELELEDRHARLQLELKDRMSLDDGNDGEVAEDGSLEPETSKSPADVHKEGAILNEMLEIVEKKESLRSMLEEDRQRYREEDRDLESQMLAKGLRLASLRQRKESQV